ncbi:MAG TPA: hypothetical protein VEZ47_10825, partial [Gemmatirosa sp.]|nr:hypothetical protein [Gemmatirosa sp.]
MPVGADDTPPLVALLDAASEAGEVDARQLADALGLAPAALRRALAAPGALPREQLEVVARTLRVDRALLRTLGRPLPDGDADAPDGAAAAASVAAPTPGAAPPPAVPAGSMGE